ncbi:hypothetical protein SDJN02_15703, partial [Cucurbita argyrosperma subsp. argyrosperma]
MPELRRAAAVAIVLETGGCGRTLVEITGELQSPSEIQNSELQR